MLLVFLPACCHQKILCHNCRRKTPPLKTNVFDVKIGIHWPRIIPLPKCPKHDNGLEAPVVFNSCFYSQNIPYVWWVPCGDSHKEAGNALQWWQASSSRRKGAFSRDLRKLQRQPCNHFLFLRAKLQAWIKAKIIYSDTNLFLDNFLQDRETSWKWKRKAASKWKVLSCSTLLMCTCAENRVTLIFQRAGVYTGNPISWGAQYVDGRKLLLKFNTLFHNPAQKAQLFIVFIA